MSSTFHWFLPTHGDGRDRAVIEVRVPMPATGPTLLAGEPQVPSEAALAMSNGLFEVAGTRAAADPLGLHRHWRNVRTPTLHDPVRWKVQHLGRHALTGVAPPRHDAL